RTGPTQIETTRRAEVTTRRAFVFMAAEVRRLVAPVKGRVGPVHRRAAPWPTVRRRLFLVAAPGGPCYGPIDSREGEFMLPRVGVIATLVATALVSTAGAATFVEFESGQVRPLALSPDGTRLFAVNTPDDRLEIFNVDGTGGLSHAGSVSVGLEPVAVAARTNGEVWVVNHLSDSVSVVDVSSSPPRVTRTLLVGDEPRDLVFAGPGRHPAF